MHRLKIYDLMTGSTDGLVHIWNTDSGARVSVLNCDHPGPVQCVSFNPKFMMLCTACTNMVCSQIQTLPYIAYFKNEPGITLEGHLPPIFQNGPPTKIHKFLQCSIFWPTSLKSNWPIIYGPRVNPANN